MTVSLFAFLVTKMVDLADLRISRPRPPKLSAADKRIQSIVKDIEVRGSFLYEPFFITVRIA